MDVTIWGVGVGITLACLNLFILNLSTFPLGVTHTNVICIPFFFATWKALIEMLGRQDQERSLSLGTECNIPNCN